MIPYVLLFVLLPIVWCVDCSEYKIISIQRESYCRHILTLSLAANAEECNYLGSSYERLYVEIDIFSKDKARVLITDLLRTSWVTSSLLPMNISKEICNLKEPLEDNPIQYSPLSIFGKTLSSLVYKEQFISVTLNANTVFGLGETVNSFKNNLRSTTIFTRDNPTETIGENVYGAQPIYVDVSPTESFGIILYSSLGMDVLVTPTSAGYNVTYNVIGGSFEFIIVRAENPVKVSSMIQEVIGYPAMMPVWSMGFHQCRWGYKNIEEVSSVVRKYRENSIPLEAMWIDIDYMDSYKLFTFSSSNFNIEAMRKLKSELSSYNQKLVLMVDPGVKIEANYPVYERGLANNVFMKNPVTHKPVVGKVWPGLVHFPDWLKSITDKWWFNEIKVWFKQLDIDGLWIDMNEVANFCDGDCFSQGTIPRNANFDPNSPPYKINNGAQHLPLNSRTSPMDALHGDKEDILDYYVHNLYGHLEARSTYSALKKLRPRERPFILTRSTFIGTGKYAAHWLGDNFSTWKSLRLSIPGMLSFSAVYGINMVGADICGFIGDTNEELCTRWTQLGAFYPFSRNHNVEKAKNQEPYEFPNALRAMKKYVYGVRYVLLPYWYSLHYLGTKGLSVVRPLVWEFPDDINTYDIDSQFMVGNAILVSPILTESARMVRSYLPKGIWYEFESGELTISQGEWKDLDAPLDTIPYHLRGGTILPHFKFPISTFTTSDLFKNESLALTVAIDSQNKTSVLASGFLYLDEEAGLVLKDDYLNAEDISGIEVKVTFKSNGNLSFLLEVNVNKVGPWKSSLKNKLRIGLVRVLGLESALDNSLILQPKRNSLNLKFDCPVKPNYWYQNGMLWLDWNDENGISFEESNTIEIKIGQ